ncbi:MAG: multicopper oxidase domain-containing protein [Methylococcales bacterium]|nr:multicopper oxidase domain-containing protein [Methylococcales bacterium]
MSKFNQSRRRFLGQSGLGLVALTTLPSIANAMESMGMGRMGMGGMHNSMGSEVNYPKLTPNKSNPNFHPDVELDLVCKPIEISILKGAATKVLHYQATLIKGPKDTVVDIPHSYLGSMIRLQKGQKVRINFHNALSQSSVVHWHGLHVPQVMDGHPQYAIESGETLVYEFEVVNRANMNMYHPHPHGATAKQVYFGLAGAVIVNDDEEAALDLPSGEYEIPLVIQDKQFDSDNQLVYSPNRHQRMTGVTGDNILVNGQANFHLEVESRAYRLRVMNGSTSRIYKLAWDDGMPMTIIGVDGGLLEQPEVKPYVMLAPGERLDVWADFSARNEGSQLMLKSLAFSGVMPKMAMGMNRSSLAVGSEYPICTIKVTRKVSESHKLPTKLAKIHRYGIHETANPNNPLPISISESPMSMLLNGRAYEFNHPLPSERVKMGSIVLLEIFHAQSNMGMGGGMGGMNMTMPHPIHLHGQQFEIMSRSISGDTSDYDTVREGFIDSGLKDTVLVMPMERIKMIKPFQDFKGLYLYHCHNLEHEDMGMMREFLVE